MKDNKVAFKKGIQHGIPIALGYFAVAFTLGIAARNAGISALQSLVISATNLSSTGEYVGFTSIAQKISYFEIALLILIANARYLLLSCSLSQKLAADMKFIHRLFLGLFVTDEIFGISVSVPEKLNPYYTYGAATVAVPGWSIGTYLGVVMGNILPDNVVSALSVGLFGMFIAIIIPPAKKDKIVAGLVVITMIISYITTRCAIFAGISSGTKIIIITVVISCVAALLFPKKEENVGGKNS